MGELQARATELAELEGTLARAERDAAVAHGALAAELAERDAALGALGLRLDGQRS